MRAKRWGALGTPGRSFVPLGRRATSEEGLRILNLLTRETLDRAGCQTPGCTRCDSIIVMSGDCHPGVPLTLTYDKKIGALRAFCFKCDAVVAEISVGWALN